MQNIISSINVIKFFKKIWFHARGELIVISQPHRYLQIFNYNKIINLFRLWNKISSNIPGSLLFFTLVSIACNKHSYTLHKLHRELCHKSQDVKSLQSAVDLLNSHFFVWCQKAPGYLQLEPSTYEVTKTTTAIIHIKILNFFVEFKQWRS